MRDSVAIVTRATIVCILTAVAFSPTGAGASEARDWFLTISNGQDLEIRNDARVFAFFSALNAVGFDAGAAARKFPVPRMLYHPVRIKVRERVLAQPATVSSILNPFFDAHPEPIDSYLSYLLAPTEIAGAPKKLRAKPASSLDGLNEAMGHLERLINIAELHGETAHEYRLLQRAYFRALEGAIARLRHRFGGLDAPPLTIFVNLLDEDDRIRTIPMADGAIAIVVGPSRELLTFEIARAYVSILLAPALKRITGSWTVGPSLLRSAREAGAPEETLEAFASRVMTNAVARWALQIPKDVGGREGIGELGIGDAAMLFNGSQAVEPLLTEALKRIEVRRSTQK